MFYVTYAMIMLSDVCDDTYMITLSDVSSVTIYSLANIDCFFLQVEITLQDINDNPPVFPTDILDLTIEENIGDGFKIMQLTATDADEVCKIIILCTYIDSY